MAMSSIAQTVQKPGQKISNPLPTNIGVQHKALVQKGVKSQAPARSAQTGLYYTRPEGTFFATWGYDGRGYGIDLLVGPPYVDLRYQNRSSVDEEFVTWTINGQDASSLVDENGDYRTSLGGAYFYAVPTLEYNGKEPDSWSLSDNSLYYVHPEGGSSYTTRATSYGMRMMSPVSDHYWTTDNEKIYNNTETWGVFGWMFGAGTLQETDEDGTNYTFTGERIEQPCGKPEAALYIDTVFIDGYSYTQPIKEGGSLTCYVCRPKLNERGQKVADLDNIIETLTCTSKDTINFGTAEQFKGKRGSTDPNDFAKPGYLIFTKKTTNRYGLEVTAPFVVNEEFVLAFDGFGQEGIDFGANGLDIAPEDEEVAYPGLEFGVWNDGEEQYIKYTSAPIAVKCGFHGMFVNYNTDIWADTETGEHLETKELRAPVEGGTVLDDATGSMTTTIQLPFEWYSEDGTENFFIDLPEWLWLQDGAVQQIVDAKYNIEESDLMYDIVLEADALPADAEVVVSTGSADEIRNARYAVLYVEGFEVKSEPIIVVQGDLSIEEAKELAAWSTGIDAPVVKIDNNGKGKIYNLNGQQVNDSYKGIVIQNGKKVIKK